MLEEATDLIRATLEERLEEKEREQALAGGFSRAVPHESRIYTQPSPV